MPFRAAPYGGTRTEVPPAGETLLDGLSTRQAKVIRGAVLNAMSHETFRRMVREVYRTRTRKEWGSR